MLIAKQHQNFCLLSCHKFRQASEHETHISFTKSDLAQFQRKGKELKVLVSFVIKVWHWDFIHVFPHQMAKCFHICNSLWLCRVLKYHTQKCVWRIWQRFFMSTWWGDSKNMKEIEFSWWLFELPAKYHSQFSSSGSIFLQCLSPSSKSHCENSISSIFLEFPHQVNMKNVVKSSQTLF